MPQPRVFISYNSKDRALALPLVEALKARGIEPWIDQEQLPPGKTWLPLLEQGLTDCTAVVVLLGPNGIGPVQQEEVSAALGQARREGKPVIPVLLTDAAPTPPLLGQYGHADLADGPQGADFERLLAALTARPAPPPPPPPREHTLEVRADGEALTARWDGGNEFPLALPLTKADLDELAWYLERYIDWPDAGEQARAAALESRLQDWGVALRDALFPGGEQNAIYAGIRDFLDADPAQRVLLTLAADSPAFLIRPWEMLRDARGPLALRGLTLRRRLRRDEAPAAGFQPGLPLRLLLIVSRPEDTGFIDPRTSVRPVLDALGALRQGADDADARIRVDFCEPPTLPELERRLSRARTAGEPYHIVHFDGHGQYSPDTGVGALCFEDDRGRTQLVPGPRLGDLLSRLQVPLVLLEACRGAQLSDRPVFGAVAPALLRAGVGSVIAFSQSVHVEAARLVSERLYQQLIQGRSIGAALEEARSRLHARRERWLTTAPDAPTVKLQDWVVPQLYQAGADPALVPAHQAAPADADELPVDDVRLPGFPPPPRYRFQGRARELLRLERLFQRHPAVLLHAGGGMGKTALAREAAHWWRRTGRFPHAVFHSFETAAGAEAVVQAIGEALGGEGFASLGPDAQWAEAVRLFRASRLLLVWDNFESVLPAFLGAPASSRPADAGSASAPAPEAASTDGPPPPPLAPAEAPRGEPADAAGGTPALHDLLPDLQRLYRDLTDTDDPKRLRGRLLVTCRPAETGLDGIAGFGLAGLARPDALHLLRGIVDRREIDLGRPGYGRDAIEALLERLEDHPLSIELIAPHLKDLTPTRIADELAQRLHQFQDPAHAEGRNRSLLASLDFSRGRLSPRARDALPWLGWFQGGMFERFLLDFSEIPASDWSAIRAELVATALLRVEDLPEFNTPYLKLHPTLADAVSAEPAAGDDTRAGRFVDVYLQVGRMIDGALGGSRPAAGMALTRLELANLRRALELAFAAGRHRDGWALGDTLGKFLNRAGRLRERDRLVERVRSAMPADRLDPAACAAIRQHAWSLFTRGQAQQALDAVQDLERRLGAGGGACELVDGDAARELALARWYRGRILLTADRPDLALTPLEQAINALRTLGDAERANLSAALGDLANALSALGRTEPALAAADEGLTINRALGHDRALAAGLGRTAAILRAAGRHAEAEARYGEALAAAERVGDLELQGTTLAHLGVLQQDTGRTAASVDTLRRALRLFQQAGNGVGEMQTCDLLGTAEQMLGRLDPAEAWYRKALGLAEQLGVQAQVGGTRQNLGILFQHRAEGLPGDDPAAAPERARWLTAAVAEIEASLAINQQRNDRLGAASSHTQLSQLHRLRGDLDRAEAEARHALAIREPLSHPETWKVYASLADIARACGDAATAADWQAKADTQREAQERRARGDDTGDPAGGGPDADPGAGAGTAPDQQLMDALLALARAVHQARTAGEPLPPDAAEALAQLAGLPAPLGGLGAFFQAIADGRTPAPPALPEPLDQLADALLEALR